MPEKPNKQSAERTVARPIKPAIPQERAEHLDYCTDADFWEAFPPDEAETLPEAGDFWLETD